jgi:predicted NBD/HSP70 family sugar kinase
VNAPFQHIPPKIIPPLDQDFKPPVLANRNFQVELAETEQSVPIIIGLERANGLLARLETRIYPEDHPSSNSNLEYIERLLKFLLWQKGGWRVYIGGPRSIGEYIQKCYSSAGSRQFDYHFMGEDVYDKPFTVVICKPEEVPPEMETSKPLGRHLEGNRIGFDLGASDRKVSAVIDGNVVFSEEVEWNPRVQSDPEYHYREIMTAIQKAAQKLPTLDSVGGSAAGIYIDNRVRIASLFRGIPKSDYHKARNLFIRIQNELGVPLEIVNDGDVTALAGSMSLEDNAVLGIAMGSSEAGGYVNPEGNITGWLNELAFAPVDYNPNAPIDEWSGDKGVGSMYFSQECIFRLAPFVDIQIPPEISKAAQLEYVQEKLEAGHPEVQKIWQTIGIYLGYSIAHYAEFYDLKHVLILGRCTSGIGGKHIIDCTNQVLKTEFPGLASRLNIQLPDEKSRRIGQAIAAASLPEL